MRRQISPVLVGSIVTVIFGSCWARVFNFSDPEQSKFAMMILLLETAIVGGGIGLVTSLFGIENLIVVALCAISGWVMAALLEGLIAALTLYWLKIAAPGMVALPIYIAIGILIGSFPSFLIWAWKRKK